MSTRLLRSPSTSRCCRRYRGGLLPAGLGEGRPEPHPSPLGTHGPARRPDWATRGVPSRIPAARPLRVERGFPAAPGVARARTASGPRVRATGTRGAPAPAPAAPATPLCAPGGRHLRSCAPPRPHSGQVTHRRRAAGCPRRRGRAPVRAPRSRGPRRPPAPGPGPAPRPGLRPGAQPRLPPAPPRAGAHRRPRARDSPARGESCGAAAAALHGDLSSELGTRRGGPAGPAWAGAAGRGKRARGGGLRARGPGWRGRPACRGLEAVARRARGRHGRGASGGRPGAAGEELAVAGLGREVPATSWCSDLHTAPGGRGSDRLASAQGLGLSCGRRAEL